jgi:hypothetical protein
MELTAPRIGPEAFFSCSTFSQRSVSLRFAFDTNPTSFLATANSAKAVTASPTHITVDRVNPIRAPTKPWSWKKNV